jgi:hypothetical protein
VRLTSRANFSQTRAALTNRARGFNANAEEFLRRAGREIAISLATSTAPYGTNNSAKQLGEAAVRRDIARVYVPSGKVFSSFPNQKQGAAFWAAITARNYAKAQNIMDAYHPIYRRIPIRPFDGGAAHQAARKNGKVSVKQRPVMVTQRDRNLLSYINKEVEHVGEAKAGWAACAKILGSTRGLPQWVTRHAGKLSGGAVVENYAGNVKTITLQNQVRYAQDALSASEKQVALRLGFDRLLRGIVAAERAGRAVHASE